jgi:hypothetical protein
MRVGFFSVIGVTILSTITTQAAPIQHSREATGLENRHISPVADLYDEGPRITFVGFLEDPIFLPEPAVGTSSSSHTGFEDLLQAIAVPFSKLELKCKGSRLLSWFCTPSPEVQEI